MQITEQALPLDGLNMAKSQQLLGWLYATVASGAVVDVAEWNRAIRTLTQEAA